MSAGGAPPTVAVVIPVWDDYVRWLGEAVDSVVDQGVAEQVIVVDNASTVPVAELPGTTVVRAPQRLSTGAARNLGLEAVRTPLVVFLDADDLMLPGSLEALVAGIDADRGVSAFCLGLVDGETGRRHRSPRRVARALARYPRAFAVANSIWSLLPTQGATIVWADVALATGGYADRSQGEDWVLGVSLAWGGRVLFGEQSALVYRWRGDSPGRSAGRPPLLANARSVRRRLRADPSIPLGVSLAMPLMAAAQLMAILGVRPLFLALRRLRATRSG
jgi:hypothetical protein